MNEDSLKQLTADIVSAHVANNSVGAGDVAGLIQATYDALAGLGQPERSEPGIPLPPREAGAVKDRKSLADPAKIISMIDGKPYSTLKRHLATHGMTPASYRKRYGLRSDYPMTAPAYSSARREIAMARGLGKKKVEAAPEVRKRGRPKGSTNKASAAKLSGQAALAKVREGDTGGE